MNKCISCPLKYIDIRNNNRCLLDKKIVNAYGCYKDLSKELKDRDIDIPNMLQEKQDYIDSTEHSNKCRGDING